MEKTSLTVTHLLGTVRDTMKCVKIVVYNRTSFSKKDDPGYNKISLYNISNVFSIIKKSGKCEELSREKADADIPFTWKHFKSGKSKVDGFNTIIYLSNIDNSPIGYTEFINTQGSDRDIDIFINLGATIELRDVLLENSVLPAKLNKRKDYLGDLLKNYTSTKTIVDDIKNIGVTTRFTNCLSTLEKGCNRDNIYLSTGLVKNIDNNIDYLNFSIEKNAEINPYNYNFTDYQFSYYGSEIVVYSLNGLNYCATSLTEKNAFNNLIVYTKSNVGYYTLPIPKDEQGDDYSVKIDYTAGKYIVCKLNDSLVGLFNIETKSWEKIDTGLVLDSLSQQEKIYKLPNGILYKEIYEIIPEIGNFYKPSIVPDLNNYMLNIRRKVGNWYILDMIRKSENVIAFIGISGILYIKPEEYTNTIIIDDNTIMIKDSDKYRIYKFIDKEVFADDTNASIVVKFDEDLLESKLNQYRRNYYPVNIKGIPNIIGAIDGVLFYLDNNKINYL